jgi:hypothetical protein
MRLPEGMVGLPGSDGTGYVVARATSGWYLVKPDGFSRITPGDLLGIGATRWLVNECDSRRRCALVVIDRATGARRALAVQLAGTAPPRDGVVSPDGRTTAIIEYPSVHLIDLVSGADRRIDAAGLIAPLVGTGMVWAPDSRHLFVAGADDRLWAVDPATGVAVGLGMDIPPVRVLSARG